jgi:HEAT repeat protein
MTAMRMPQGRCGFETFFAERHVAASTTNDLLSALHNGDPQVRMVTARVLACEDAKETIPNLVENLETEKVKWVQQDIAIALMEMGDERGIVSLRKDCTDATLEKDYSMVAAEYLLDLHDESCLGVVLESLQTNPQFNWWGATYRDGSDGWDLELRFAALAMAPDLGGLSSAEFAQLRAAVLNCLEDSSPDIRAQASIALAELGDDSVIPRLQAAIFTESDKHARKYMAYSLKVLEDSRDNPNHESELDRWRPYGRLTVECPVTW